jgi:hypothetical protein
MVGARGPQRQGPCGGSRAAAEAAWASTGTCKCKELKVKWICCRDCAALEYRRTYTVTLQMELLFWLRSGLSVTSGQGPGYQLGPCPSHRINAVGSSVEMSTIVCQMVCLRSAISSAIAISSRAICKFFIYIDSRYSCSDAVRHDELHPFFACQC